MIFASHMACKHLNNYRFYPIFFLHYIGVGIILDATILRDTLPILDFNCNTHELGVTVSNCFDDQMWGSSCTVQDVTLDFLCSCEGAMPLLLYSSESFWPNLLRPCWHVKLTITQIA